tara:strand:- start:1358 stop:2101 length:744 start_codon:yes stop_codon:yes gene_type:complete
VGPTLLCRSGEARVVVQVAPNLVRLCRRAASAAAEGADDQRGSDDGASDSDDDDADDDGAAAAAAAAAATAHADASEAEVACGRLRLISAGCTLARRSRRGVFRLTPEGARVCLPFAKRARQLPLEAADAVLLLRRANKLLPIESLSAAAAAAARRLPLGPCFVMLRPAAGTRVDAGALVLPARRLGAKDALRLQLLYTAGLEFRPAATADALGTMLLPKPPKDAAGLGGGVAVHADEPEEAVDGVE